LNYIRKLFDYFNEPEKDYNARNKIHLKNNPQKWVYRLMKTASYNEFISSEDFRKNDLIKIEIAGNEKPFGWVKYEDLEEYAVNRINESNILNSNIEMIDTEVFLFDVNGKSILTPIRSIMMESPSVAEFILNLENKPPTILHLYGLKYSIYHNLKDYPDSVKYYNEKNKILMDLTFDTIIALYKSDFINGYTSHWPTEINDMMEEVMEVLNERKSNQK
jgi:hypothetical protein